VRHVSALLCCVLLAAVGCHAGSLPSVQDGDIIFQTSLSSQSEAVQRATHSPYSHMGMVLYREGTPYVFEAAATVRYTPLGQWINRGRGHHFVVKRLEGAPKIDGERLSALRKEAHSFEGRPYDLAFGWSDERLYCSELVWKLYARAIGVQIGELQRLRDFDLTDPVVKSKLHERYGNAIPLDESVISPAAMFSSSLLRTVARE
jgi:Permuted papain-like amidase enzyme, YaeF/YiiX, C92 family